MTASSLAPVQPDADAVSTAVQALPHIQDYLVRHPGRRVRLVVDDEHGDEALTVPRGAVELLEQILAHMAAGHGVSVVPAHAELTTQQAADLLNVSRPFLISLLEAHEIEYRRVGKHRRIEADSLMQYMRADDQGRREAAGTITALNQEMGLV